MNLSEVSKIVMIGGTPRIDDTRVAVYDIMDGLRRDWTAAVIAEWFELTIHQVDAAIRYIEENREVVESAYRAIIERHAKGNPPELVERLLKSKGKAAVLREQLRTTAQEVHYAGNTGGH